MFHEGFGSSTHQILLTTVIRIISTNSTLLAHSLGLGPGQVLSSNIVSLWRQCELTSFLLFSVADSGRNKIKCFSLVQRLHVFVMGENGEALAINFHLMSKSISLFFNFQMYELRVVSCAYFSCLNDFLWFPNLFLKGGAVIPTYFSVIPSLEETVAWYTIFFSRHCPSKGQTAFFGQLQVLALGLGFS